MKKLFILVCLLTFATSVLSAGTLWILGGSVGFASQNTGANTPWSATSAGFMGDWYQDFAGSFGIYTALTMGFILGASDNGVAVDLGQYTGGAFDLNVLLGIGYRLPLPKRWNCVLAAGAYYGNTTLDTFNYSLPEYFAGGFGVGAGASLAYSLSFNWGIGVNVNLGYSFFEPTGYSTLPPSMAPTGLKVFGGVGASFSY